VVTRSPPLRPLGRTGLRVCPIAFGAFKIGRNEKIKYPQPYDLPSEAEAQALLEGVLDLGINLIDTAPAYGLSEERIGRLPPHRRDQCIISTKVGEAFEAGESRYDFSAAAVEASIHRSLGRLRREVLDIVLVHSDGRDEHILRHTPCVETLQKLRDRGLIRHLGFSGKTVAGAVGAVPWADVLMVEYHPGDTSHEPAMALAAAKGVGVMVKKPLASGTLPPAMAIPWILQNPSVSTLVIGGLSLQHMRQNLLHAIPGPKVEM
jgi:aryl-alcohol dehydrogenase-like predicted oxidoreductase